MHELSVCQSLIAEVERVAAAHDAERATKLTLAIGPLSGVEAPLLERAFTIARAGTVAEEAELEIEIMPVNVWCEECRTESEAEVNALVCERCGTWMVALRSGDELLLKSVELAGTRDPAREAPPVAAAMRG